MTNTASLYCADISLYGMWCISGRVKANKSVRITHFPLSDYRYDFFFFFQCLTDTDTEYRIGSSLVVTQKRTKKRAEHTLQMNANTAMYLLDF